VFHGEKSGVSETTMRPSHFTLATAAYPETTARSGNP
jgi:hypothetical protein